MERVMAAATSYIPIELYLRSHYEPAAEYVDGVIEERAAPEFDHAAWQEAILAWFRLHAAEWNTRALPQLRVQVAATRFLIPEVTVLDRTLAIEQTITHAPLGVLEIISSEDTIQRSLRKLADYKAMGIQQIWLIDTDTRTYYQFKQGKLAQATHFSGPEDRVRFAISEIEAFLD